MSRRNGLINEIIVAAAMLTTVVIKPQVEFIPVKLELSAFCPCYECSEGWGRQTASGIRLEQSKGHIALPRELPYGTKLSVPGERTYVNVDRGGYIKKVDDVYRVDVFMEKHQDTVEYGRKRKWGYIIKKKE